MCDSRDHFHTYPSTLPQVEDSWKATEFIILPHRESKDVFILGGTDDIQQLLDDSNINMATIASSRHVGPIRWRLETFKSANGMMFEYSNEQELNMTLF